MDRCSSERTLDDRRRWRLEDRIEAAACAGYAGIGFWLGDLLVWRESGGDCPTLRARLSDAFRALSLGGAVVRSYDTSAALFSPIAVSAQDQ